MKYFLGLNFIDDKEQKLPSGPRATIYVSRHNVDKQKRIIITLGDCASIEELQENVVRLKTELDEIVKEASEKFKKSRQNRPVK